MKTIKINGTECKVKYTIRALLLYEKITGQSFQMRDTMEEMVFFYCMVLANNKDIELTFEQFLDAIDEDPNIVLQFTEILTAQAQQKKMLDDAVEEAEQQSDDKKK